MPACADLLTTREPQHGLSRWTNDVEEALSTLMSSREIRLESYPFRKSQRSECASRLCFSTSKGCSIDIAGDTHRMTLCSAIAIVHEQITLFIEVIIFVLFIDLRECRVFQEAAARGWTAADVAEERFCFREVHPRGGYGREQLLEGVRHGHCAMRVRLHRQQGIRR